MMFPTVVFRVSLPTSVSSGKFSHMHADDCAFVRERHIVRFCFTDGSEQVSLAEHM